MQHNNLFGKTIVWNGDSICAGKAFDDTAETDAWAGRIAKRNSMTYKNYAVGGGTVTENVPFAGGKMRHSVCGTLDKMYREYPNADYVIFDGGTNDADLLGNVTRGDIPTRLGSFDKHDFSGSYDTSTFCGAFESLVYRLTKYYKGKKIGYIVAQKMGIKSAGYTADVNNRRAYFEIAIAICEKWGIPYLDLWRGCYLNPRLTWMYDKDKTPEENVAAGSLYADGQHLTATGYDFESEIIEAWLRTL